MDTSLFTDASLIDFGLFVAGCVAGYGFATKTLLKAANERIDEIKEECERERIEHKDEIAELKARILSLEEQRFQLAWKKNNDAT